MALKKLAFSCQSVVRSGFMAASFAVAMVFSTLAIAQTTTPCDPQYMDALESRAYLEAQREISVNQSLIVKPDSVLEYSCFDQILGMMARAPGDRGNFSESDRWGEVPNHGPTSLDVALADVVTKTLIEYDKANFGGKYLGGRSAYQSYVHKLNVGPNPGSYSCNEMNKVWMEAKCANFQGPPVGEMEIDGFYDFAHLKGMDPRKYPQACSKNGITDEWIKRAFNNEEARYVLSPENPLDTTPYVVDPLVTYLAKINPFGVKPALVCADGIPTGVVVFRQGFSPEYYKEKVCPNPGCYYVPSGEGKSAAAPSETGKCESN